MFAHHDREVDYAYEAIEEARRTFKVEMRYYTLMDLALVSLNGFLIVSVVGWAIWLWSAGTASIGVVAVDAVAGVFDDEAHFFEAGVEFHIEVPRGEFLRREDR